MERSRYKRWIKQVDSVVALKLVYDDGELRILGLDRASSVTVELYFQDILLIRISPEEVRLRLFQELGTVQSLVLIDEQSELIDWLSEEGLHTRDMRQSKHFIVFIGEEIIDVVSLSKPKVSTNGAMLETCVRNK